MSLFTPHRLLAAVLATLLTGCSSVAWQGQVRPDSDTVARALNGAETQVALWDLPADSLPHFPVPQNVRPCCAFGNLQKVAIGRVPIPLFRLGNTVGAGDVGPHQFDGGTFAYTSSGASANGNRGSENNGMIYTLQGGFIDLAHVRDTADDTVALFFEMVRHLGEEHRIELPDEIGERYIQMQTVELPELTNRERWELAAELAARMAYFKAESHEIAQWHGYASFAGWPETVSAFSPEDLYSNMLGAKLARALISANLVLNSDLYNQSMTLWLDEALDWLGAVDRGTSNALFDVIDGHWWDSSRPIPAKYMVTLRHYQMGDQQTPYLVPVEWARDSRHWDRLDTFLAAGQQPHPLALQPQMFGLELDTLAQVVMTVSPRYQASFAQFDEALWRHGFTHLDYPAIVSRSRELDQIEYQKLLGQ
ncbi:DUF4056 domain-containing protein [Ferrimonas marina]|uniref:DUF4056 domain-containing protein n=1 Tax=Ferrimonas marina TaxID=299255 RepID=UPI0009E7CF90|nr:DUF4056 domain-containing protein [Ferrimonas marina]